MRHVYFTDQPEPNDPLRPGLLANLTGRRGWLAALILLGAYLVPVVGAWAIPRYADPAWFDGRLWPIVVASIVVGPVLVIVLSFVFGAVVNGPNPSRSDWAEFGEDYSQTFPEGPAILLMLWRFVLQVAALCLTTILVAGADWDQSRQAMMVIIGSIPVPT